MIMRLVLFAAALVLGAASSAAQQGDGFAWKLNDEKAPPNPAQASQNGFGVMMMVTDEPKGFLEAWGGSTPPNVSVTERVTLAKPVETMIIFSGCRAAQDGNCDVRARLWITAPDGKPYGDVLTGQIWKGPPGEPYALQLGLSGIGFRLEPQDPLGVYILHAGVTDQVAANTVSVRQPVTAAKQ